MREVEREKKRKRQEPGDVLRRDERKLSATTYTKTVIFIIIFWGGKLYSLTRDFTAFHFLNHPFIISLQKTLTHIHKILKAPRRVCFSVVSPLCSLMRFRCEHLEQPAGSYLLQLFFSSSTKGESGARFMRVL